MGLDIGVEVKKQREGYMSHGVNPKGSLGEIEDRFFSFLHEKIPGDMLFGGGGVSLVNWDSITRGRDEEWFNFRVRLFGRGSALEEAGYTTNDLYLAMMEFVLNEFSVHDDIEMRVYWSG